MSESTTKTDSDFFCTIEADADRVALFREVFGSPRVPVMTPVPMMADLPGKPSPTAVYLLDLKAIGPTERRRLIRHLSRRFKCTELQSEEILNIEGLPIVAEGTSLLILNAPKWFG